MDFKRTTEYEREPSAPGVIRGVLATDGEASDGHILSIKGGDVSVGLPLMFGHDDLPVGDVLRHIGTWTGFSKQRAGGALGAAKLIGEARIETDAGDGANLAFRKDIAAMVEAKHLRGLSLRWEPIDKPVPRTSLPSEHPAYVDAKRDGDGARRWGLFFPTWRAVEGSIVSIGADRQAQIQRAEASGTPEELRAFWRSAVSNFDRHARDPELEWKRRKQLLELYPVADAVSDVPAAPAAPVDRVELEAIEAEISRLYAEAASRHNLSGLAKEIVRLSRERVARRMGK